MDSEKPKFHRAVFEKAITFTPSLKFGLLLLSPRVSWGENFLNLFLMFSPDRWQLKRWSKFSAGFMLAGLGFVVALAWNDAVQSLFNQLFGPTGNTVIAKFVHALFITAVATIVAVRLGRDIGPK